MGYVQPVPGAARRRSDQGRDYQGTPGSHVVAIGRARVDAVKADPKGFGVAIYYTLLDGPAKGTQIYVGHAQATVKAGQVVAAGAPVATLLQSGLGNAAGMPGWTEVGIAKGGAPALSSGGGEALDKLLKGASAGSPNAPVAQTPTPSVGSQVSVAPSVQAPTDAPPPTAIGLPGADVTPPGGTSFQLWQQVAQGGLVSPDTTMFLRNAQLASGG